jgi:hypothetical protein
VAQFTAVPVIDAATLAYHVSVTPETARMSAAATRPSTLIGLLMPET